MVNAGPRTEDSIPVIESEELKLSRDEENLLGEGGFGKVYKGKWNGTDVAIKEIKTHLRNRMHQEQVIKNDVTQTDTCIVAPLKEAATNVET